MHLSALLPQLKGLKVDDVLVHETHITLFLTAVRRTATCPGCGQPARRIHSRYPRTIADLPWSGRSVSLHVQARRFFCANPSCLRKLFCERLPQLMAVYARTTEALRTALQQLGFALGGKAGARLATTLQMRTSRMTVLRLVRAVPPPHPSTPRVLGVDD